MPGKKEPKGLPPLFLVSGGAGTSGEQLVRTALAQFPQANVELVILPQVRNLKKVQEAVERAADAGGTLVHTLVDAKLRRALIRQARDRHVTAIDLMGRLLSRLATLLGQQPAGQPGLYRQLHEEYFERVEALEFAVAHDDGRQVHELPLAEIVLIGASRVGKTPLSIYLALLGWKVANLPLLAEVPPPPELFAVDPRRVVGLTISLDQLVIHRCLRSRRLQMDDQTSYTDVAQLRAEIEMTRQLCRRHGFVSIEVTDRPIEESADQVIELVSRRLEGGKV